MKSLRQWFPLLGLCGLVVFTSSSRAVPTAANTKPMTPGKPAAAWVGLSGPKTKTGPPWPVMVKVPLSGPSLGQAGTCPCIGKPGVVHLVNDDGTPEAAYSWQYGGLSSCAGYYGAFAEEYTGSSVCGIDLTLSAPAFLWSATCDLFVWADGFYGPGSVLQIVHDAPVPGIPAAPNCEDYALTIPATAIPSGPANFWVGYWPTFVGPATYYVAADEGTAPSKGFPFFKVAPGIGYPTGWQPAYYLWGPQLEDFYISCWASQSPSPVNQIPNTTPCP